MAVSGSLGVMLSLQVREKLIFQVGDENLSHPILIGALYHPMTNGCVCLLSCI